MPMILDETHDARRQSWVPGAAGHCIFPLQNLPFGIFSPAGGNPRGGVAIGNSILEIGKILESGLFSGEAEIAARAAAGDSLNPLLALQPASRIALRKQLFALLAEDSSRAHETETKIRNALHKMDECTLHLPAKIGDYTDFYAGIHHAYNGGVRQKRDPPLMPNYRYVPVAYHGRASSIVVSGQPVWRPNGQLKLPDEPAPIFGPARKLDFELELGVWIGPGNPRGKPIPISTASEHIAGLCMLNDWSARDIQAWESAPLGPFLAKNFTSTISPWIITTEALAPFRQAQLPRPAGDPQPLNYLQDKADQESGALNITIEALISTEKMRTQDLPPHSLSSSNLHHLYWTLAQLVAHHTCGGCNLQPGDLFGSGTISAPVRTGWGSLAELSEDGKTPLRLPSGETRTYLHDGDDIILRAIAEREGYATIGFGDCIGRITATQ